MSAQPSPWVRVTSKRLELTRRVANLLGVEGHQHLASRVQSLGDLQTQLAFNEGFELSG